eukprot:Colp12_sorted_trinity150504_noHs@17702
MQLLELTHALVYVFRTLLEGKPQNQQVCLINDYTDWKLAQSNNKASKVYLEAAQLLLPERIGVSYMVNTPSAFRILWRLLRPWMSKRTVEKTQVKSLNALCEDQNLPEGARLKEHGGTHEFDVDAYIAARQQADGVSGASGTECRHRPQEPIASALEEVRSPMDELRGMGNVNWEEYVKEGHL